MINVCVGCFKAPDLWVFGEIGFHVVMNKLLKIYAKFSVRANHHIGAYTFVCGDITIRI